MIKFLDLQKVNSQYSDELHQAATRVIDSGWYLQGREVECFEKEYADYIGTKFCVTCGNGLDALTLMLRAYIQMGKLHEGDEVIVPANTFIATILSITENHLVPVLVEPNPDSLQIDDSLIESKVTSRTKAILLVHLYGICSYTERVGELCKNLDLLILEDNAQAHGCTYENEHDLTDPNLKLHDSKVDSTISEKISSNFEKNSTISDNHSKIFKTTKLRTGSLGDAAAHSFYPGKNLGALGDAGAVTTNDEELAKTLRAICNYGFSKKYYADNLGRNSRMDELQAAFLRVKLKHLEDDNAHRKTIADYYMQHINNPLVRVPRVESVFHIFTIFCKHRNALRDYLTSRGIQTLIHYPVPPHLQKCYPEMNDLKLPITEQLADEELSLPISPVLTLTEAAEVVKAINEFDRPI